ncbi:MAG: hypothetical protein HC809_13770 [Gammaproteobacteria bacterium]|nr:hypothetical protein [Gammaproteobacteria bacterium]
MELISVLLLLGILSAVAMSRMVKSSAYAPSLVTAEVVALTRLGQQLAMARQDATVSLELQSIAGSWRLRVRVDSGGGPVDERVQETQRSNTSVAVSNGATTVMLATDPLILAFDGMGNLDSATIGTTLLDPSVGIEVAVLGDSNRTVCVSATGYAFRDACA